MSRTKRRRQRALERYLESLSIEYGTIADPRDALLDPETGEEWLPLGFEGRAAWEHIGAPQTEEELQIVRQRSRYLATTNGFCINGLENRISYVVGSGHSYSVEAKEGEAIDEAELKAVEAEIERFVVENRWHARQQEIVRRLDRDGECFLRVFPTADGMLRVRFVEPAQVSTPAAKSADPAASFGIQIDPDDVETVLGYWIDGVLVPADQIQHRKANVDANVKRGMPTFWPVRKGLERAERLLRNLAAKVEIHTALAMIRRHKGGNAASVQAFVSGGATTSVYNSTLGTTDYAKRYPPGTIIDAPVNTEYDFPAASLGVPEIVQAIQAQLRAVASRLVMPEFMLSSDASNANYSSTMVAEGPAVKMFERLQWSMIEADTELLKQMLRLAEAAGRLSTGIVDRIDVVATPPNVLTRNRLQDAQADNILVAAGAMSRRTMAERNDLDWSVEEERIADDDARRQTFNPMADLLANARRGAEDEPPDIQGSGQ